VHALLVFRGHFVPSFPFIGGGALPINKLLLRDIWSVRIFIFVPFAESAKTNMESTKGCPIFRLQRALLRLANLNGLDFDNHILSAGHVLIAIFDIEMKKLVLQDSVKKKVGPLLLKALQSFEFCFDEQYHQFPVTTVEDACRIRSGWQFLMDEYQNYFVLTEHEDIGKLLRDHCVMLSLGSLNERFSTYTPRENDPIIDVSEILSKMIVMNVDGKHPWWFSANLGYTVNLMNVQ